MDRKFEIGDLRDAPTPETDAQVRTFSSISKLKNRFENKTGTVSLDFSRKLERQRNNLQDQRDFCMGEMERLQKLKDKACRSLELIAEDCEAWLASECQDPSAEFIRLVAKYAREALR